VAVVIRLTRLGHKKAPFYRIVATDKQSKRDGRFLEVLGTVNTLTNPHKVTLKEDRIKIRIEKGAELSTTVRSILKKNIPNYIEEKEAKKLKKIQALRKKRKERSKPAKQSEKKIESKAKKVKKDKK